MLKWYWQLYFKALKRSSASPIYKQLEKSSLFQLGWNANPAARSLNKVLDYCQLHGKCISLQNFLRQQQKSLQQQNIVQSQRIKSLKQLNEQFSKSLADLEKCHQTQQANIQGELKKDMAVLQKKMLKNTVLSLIFLKGLQ